MLLGLEVEMQCAQAAYIHVLNLLQGGKGGWILILLERHHRLRPSEGGFSGVLHAELVV